MAQVLNISEIVQSVVQEALEQGGHAEVAAQNGSGMLEELQEEFPQATIVTLSMAELLSTVQESVENQDTEVWRLDE
jgi:CheY-like chemotaxis protein